MAAAEHDVEEDRRRWEERLKRVARHEPSPNPRTLLRIKTEKQKPDEAGSKPLDA